MGRLPGDAGRSRRRSQRLAAALGRCAAIALLAGCASGDAAPDVAARAVEAGTTPVSLVDLGVEALTLPAGETYLLSAVPYDSALRALPTGRLSFASDDDSVATVEASGRITAHTPGRVNLVVRAGNIADTLPVVVYAPGNDRAVRVDVFPERTFQQIVGWEAHHQSGEINCGPANFAVYRDSLFDHAVGELGVNRIRIEVRSGMEAPNLERPGGNEAQPTDVDFRTPWFTPVNDNADPFTVNPDGFQFEWFDYNVRSVVLPLRERLAARGERLYLVLTYVDFFESTAWEQMRNPEEYAELITHTFEHMRDTFGFVPDALEVILEPDNTPWGPEEVGRALVAAGDRLAKAGFTPTFIAPSTTNLSEAVRFYDRLRAVPRVLEYLDVLSYHRYSGISRPALRQIALRSRRDGVQTAMLESTGGGAVELHEDLRLGRVGAWQRFALAYCGRRVNPDADGVYYQIALVRGARPQVVFTNTARRLRHYFAFIREGAVRLGASASSDDVSPVAFRNRDGGTVVVLQVRAAGPFAVTGLPAGNYAMLFTGSGESLERPVRSVAGGAAFADSVPEAGVVTIFPR